MTGKTAADHLVARRIDSPARITSGHGTNAFEVLEDRLYTPETPTSQNGSLRGLADSQRNVYRRFGERVVRLGGGTSANGAYGAPSEEGGDGCNRKGTTDSRTAHDFTPGVSTADARALPARPTPTLMKYTPVQSRWMRRYSGLLITPQAMRGGAAVEVPPATA